MRVCNYKKPDIHGLPNNWPGRRSRNFRCARCKKIRRMWLRGNEALGIPEIKIRVYSKHYAGEGRVCHICRIREVIPDWRPGDEIPESLLDG